ncbi:MAG: hypothetical protein KGH72_02205 [Candidatus Micrarchaeota archaeon]|nr:hypothetical protein [Candidatus Micrarchaeota archaeon]
MDRRDNAPQESGFAKDLEEEVEYDDRVTYNGKTYRVPYKLIKEVTFTKLNQAELRDIEHSARLQYRLLLMDPVLRAKVEFIRGKITIIYNPVGADNRKEKISMRDLIDFLAKEGVYVDSNSMSERDVDYVEEIFKTQFDPASIREHPPYSYSLAEWKKMKPKYEKEKAEFDKAKLDKFHEWQGKYISSYPEIAGELGIKVDEQPKKPSLKDRIFGKKKEKEKGFWFHGA